jgi:hypothetical protein
MTDPIKCEQCRWWLKPRFKHNQVEEGGHIVGECRRRSPTIMSMIGQPCAVFPNTSDDCFCGEAEPKE